MASGRFFAGERSSERVRISQVSIEEVERRDEADQVQVRLPERLDRPDVAPVAVEAVGEDAAASLESSPGATSLAEVVTGRRQPALGERPGEKT